MSLIVHSDGFAPYEWKFGKPFTAKWGGRCYVDASGPELVFIRQHFTGLPMTTWPTVRWHGEFAQFVLNNLDLAQAEHWLKTVAIETL